MVSAVLQTSFLGDMILTTPLLERLAERGRVVVVATPANAALLVNHRAVHEVIVFDKMKTVSRGYASLDYEMLEYRSSDLVRLDMLINGDVIDAFSVIVHKDKAYEWGRKVAVILKELIPRQLFEVAIQATIGQKIIARETVKPLRKDVLAKCYGGDISRKRKLLEKQKEGKKRMKQVGVVEVPQEAFMSILRLD